MEWKKNTEKHGKDWILSQNSGRIIFLKWNINKEKKKFYGVHSFFFFFVRFDYMYVIWLLCKHNKAHAQKNETVYDMKKNIVFLLVWLGKYNFALYFLYFLIQFCKHKTKIELTPSAIFYFIFLLIFFFHFSSTHAWSWLYVFLFNIIQ